MNVAPITGLQNLLLIFLFYHLINTDFRKEFQQKLPLFHWLSIYIKLLTIRKFQLYNICIDYRKAFDTVNHDILIKKLDKYGIRGPALSLIKSYLHSRTQRVNISGHLSSPKLIKIGVPQGSCLGPLLYLLYVNDLPNISDFTFPILYADDTTLCMRGDSLNDLVNSANVELQNFYDWSTANRLTINTDKTFTMTITKKRLPPVLPAIMLNQIQIPSQCSGRFLGVTLDENLTFKLHISQICKKVARSTGIFYKLQHYLPTTSLISLYYTFIYPHLLYCNLAWGNSAESHLNQLFVLQKKVIRIINKVPHNSHTNNLFFKNQILKLSDINKLKIGSYMYSNPSIEYNTSHNHDTRHRHNLTPRFQRTALTQRSLTYSAPTLWNTIPPHIRSSINIRVFKLNYKKHLVAGYASLPI